MPIIVCLSACQPSTQTFLFRELNPEQSGIHFSNTIEEKEKVVNEFLYMGGGVGIGDFNNDGRHDIFFTGNQVSSRLYVNTGNLTFKDITNKAGLVTQKWTTGVSIVDINNDGYDDIYVCAYRGKNLLFINNGDLTFSEQAEAYGLADSGDSTQAAFFDYNQDGRIDVFLTHYRLEGPNPNALHRPNDSGYSPANDKLYLNVGNAPGKNHPVFQDVTQKAGIHGDGYGLSASVSDFNNDSWPDIYVANDFLSGDELWLNNKDGTFTNVIDRALRHQSYSSMGSVAADINNDFYPDIITLDMAPEYNKRQKLQYTFMDYQRYQKERAMGYQPAFMRNMLHINNGVKNSAGKALPIFSEIGQYAGIAETDWSWSVLASDLNNDGWKDLYITNGSGRDFLNADFIEQSASKTIGMRNPNARQKTQYKQLKELGYIELSNYLYLNNGDYTFTNAQDSLGTDRPTISNGAASTDLDNDGDLDLVVNNINEPASVLVNTTIQAQKVDPDKHFLQIELTGSSTNLDARGTKVFLYAGNQTQLQEQYPGRGYLSSVDQRLFFGLGSTQHVDSLVVIWPDHKRQIIRHFSADTTLKLTYGEAQPFQENQSAEKPLFQRLTKEKSIHYKHLDVPYNDFKSQPLLPQKYSQLGPYITTTDVDQNGLEDFFIGGGFNSSGALFRQQKNGEFHHVTFDTTKKYQEDMDCTFFDADNDGDPDLLITYGGSRYHAGSVYYKPRLYINDGNGNFQLLSSAIPDHVRTIAGTVAIADYNSDGFKDVFIGGRISNMYPKMPRSFLLQNQDGIFRDVTAQVNSALQKPGMITSAVWTDINDDTHPDLVMAGEWMSLRFFKNTGSELQEITKQAGIGMIKGLWGSLCPCDIDRDGDTDFVAGNLGANNPYHVTRQAPLKLYAADIDKNGLTDPIPFYYIKNKNDTRKLYPAYKLDKLLRQVPTLEKLFPTHRDYANASVEDIFQTVNKENILELTVNETRSSIFENKNGRFAQHPLPAEAQFAPVNAILCNDFNEDGNTDLLLAGNEYQTAVRTGRYDAFYGYFLKSNGDFTFDPVSPTQSGFIVKGAVKDMEMISHQGSKLILVAVNNDSLQVFGINR